MKKIIELVDQNDSYEVYILVDENQLSSAMEILKSSIASLDGFTESEEFGKIDYLLEQLTLSQIHYEFMPTKPDEIFMY